MKEIEKILVIANLIKSERIAQKKSASAIAALSGISQQFLSEIERGKKDLPFSSLNAVFKALDIHFNNDTSIAITANSIFEEMIDCFIRFDRKGFESKIAVLSLSDYKYSYAFFYYYIASIAKAALIKRSMSKCVPIKMVNSSLMMFQYYCFAHSEPNEKKKYIEQGLACHMPADDSKTALSIYHLLLSEMASCYESSHDLLHSVDLYKKVSDYMALNYYKFFSLSSKLSIGIIYSKMGEISESTQIFKSIISIINSNNSPDSFEYEVMNAAKFNLATNYLIKGDYKGCKDISIKLMSLSGYPNIYNSLFYLLTISCFMLEEADESKKYCNCYSFNSDVNSNITNEVIFLFQDFYNNKISTDRLKKLFYRTLQSGDDSDIDIIFRIISKFLKAQKEVELLINIYEDYIKARIKKT